MDLAGKSTTDSARLGGRSRCVVRPLNANRLSVWLGLGALTHLRITVLPHRRSTRWCDVWRLRFHPDVIEYLPYIGAVRDERY